MPAATDRWNRRDSLRGLLFLGAGLLVMTLFGVAIRNSGSAFVDLLGGVGGFAIGPVFVVLGLNAIYRGLRGK